MLKADYNKLNFARIITERASLPFHGFLQILAPAFAPVRGANFHWDSPK